MFYRIGEWMSAETPPKNNEKKHYALSLEYISRPDMEHGPANVSEKFFRYFNNEWQYYENGEYFPIANWHWKVMAYATISPLEAYKRLAE